MVMYIIVMEMYVTTAYLYISAAMLYIAVMGMHISARIMYIAVTGTYITAANLYISAGKMYRSTGNFVRQTAEMRGLPAKTRIPARPARGGMAEFINSTSLIWRQSVFLCFNPPDIIGGGQQKRGITTNRPARRCKKKFFGRLPRPWPGVAQLALYDLMSRTWNAVQPTTRNVKLKRNNKLRDMEILAHGTGEAILAADLPSKQATLFVETL